MCSTDLVGRLRTAAWWRPRTRRTSPRWRRREPRPPAPDSCSLSHPEAFKCHFDKKTGIQFLSVLFVVVLCLSVIEYSLFSCLLSVRYCLLFSRSWSLCPFLMIVFCSCILSVRSWLFFYRSWLLFSLLIFCLFVPNYFLTVPDYCFLFSYFVCPPDNFRSVPDNFRSVPDNFLSVPDNFLSFSDNFLSVPY